MRAVNRVRTNGGQRIRRRLWAMAGQAARPIRHKKLSFFGRMDNHHACIPSPSPDEPLLVRHHQSNNDGGRMPERWSVSGLSCRQRSSPHLWPRAPDRAARISCVDSGYTSLLRPQLGRSWVIRRRQRRRRPSRKPYRGKHARRPLRRPGLCDRHPAKSRCVNLYDYVVLLGLSGRSIHFHNRRSAIHKTVRRFSAILEKGR